MRFDKVLLLGSGKIACDCVAYLAKILDLEKVCVLETAESPVSMLKIFCAKNKIAYNNIFDKRAIESFVIDFVSSRKVLIISANNRFIFTARIIQMPNVEIINFHYALLPRYRGMNIPTWVIFNGEQKTGITWHFVNEQIDHGKIIVQKEIPIDETATAFDIARKGMILGIAAFKEFIGELLERPIAGREVIYDDSEPVYKSKALPMEGILLADFDLDLLGRLLRCFDWGKMEVIRKPYVIFEGKCFVTEKYRITECEYKDKRVYELCNDSLVIYEKNKKITMRLLECDDMTTTEILQKVGELKNKRRGGVKTNCCLPLAHYPVQKEWDAFSSDFSLFFVNKTDGVRRILFYTLDFADFAKLLALNFCDKECVVEIMGRNPKQFSGELAGISFFCLERQQRLSSTDALFCFSRQSAAYEYKMADADCFAGEHDVEAIHDKLHYVFDTRSSHLQTLEEVKNSIQNKEYSIVKNSVGEIQTLLQTAITPKSLYINEIVNYGERSAIHALLKRRIFDYAQRGGKYIYSWVEEKNIASQKFHAKYGLKHDGMWNCVYTTGARGGVRFNTFSLPSIFAYWQKEAA